MDRLAVNIAADVKDEGLAFEGREDLGDGRALNAADAFEYEHAGGHGRPGVPGAYRCTGLAVLYKIEGQPYR